jgi:hypothetical protein
MTNAKNFHKTMIEMGMCSFDTSIMGKVVKDNSRSESEVKAIMNSLFPAKVGRDASGWFVAKGGEITRCHNYATARFLSK